MTIKKEDAVFLLETKLGPLSFGRYLRVYRERLELSQVDVAKRLKMAKGTLCDIEKERQIVSPKLALSIAKKLKLSEKLALKLCLQDQLRKLNLKFQIELVA